MSSQQRITSPWWFTEKITKKYLRHSVPYLKGRLLDAGCGNKPYKELFDCEEYVGMEMSETFRPDIVGDIRNMEMIEDGSFDSVLSNQVLEHIDDAEKVIKEMYRVLKPGGHLCVTVPFIGRLHGMPHDYWRFSISGLRYLLEKNRFEVISIEPMGGFLTTQCYLWLFYIHEKTLKYFATRYLYGILLIFLNPLFLLLHRIDRDKTTPHNYYALAEKRA
jgi:SAM-dependent methyltransferase